MVVLFIYKTSRVITLGEVSDHATFLFRQQLYWARLITNTTKKLLIGCTFLDLADLLFLGIKNFLNKFSFQVS